MKTPVLTLLTMAFISISTQAGYSAKIFEQGSKKQKALATLEVETSPKEDQERTHSVYKDMDGQVLIDETAVLQGSKLVSMELEHKQLGQKAKIEVKNGKVFFSKTVDGKETVKEETLREPLVVGANFQKFVRENWATISNGKTVELRFGVWDRQETVGFEIFKIADDKSGDTPVKVLKFKPSSFIISALVKPIIFVFQADGSKLLEMNGRVPFKRKSGSSWKDVDAEVYYSY